MNLRTPLGKVRGLGSAHVGTGHFIAQRLTALALIPLMLWFIASLLALVSADYATVTAWIRRPWNTVFLMVFIVVTFYHLQLGLQMVLEDYVHHELIKTASLVFMNFTIILLTVAAVFTVLRIALGG